jgi:endoglucanase
MYRFRVFAAALLCASLVPLGSNGQAPADGNYTITNACNGKALGLQNGNPGPWDNAILRDTNTPGAIAWQVNAAGDGSYILRANGTQSALQTAYGKTANETNVDLWTYVNGASQRWVISDGGNGTFKFALAASPAMALDAKYGGANGETEVWLYNDNGTCAQRWSMKPAAGGGGGGNPGDAFAMTKKIGRGINFGNIVEASPLEGSWGLSLSDELFDKAKEAGFATIRLPVRWSNYAQATAPYTIDASFFVRVDYAINAALSRGMNIVVNMHHHRQLCGETLDNGEKNIDAAVLDDRFIAMWSQIATRYKDQPNDRVVLEPYNEPNTSCNGARWNTLAKRALDEIRKTNPSRFVVLGPSSWNSPYALKDFTPPDDPRVIITFHDYSPFQFTHQGASWAGGDADSWLGTTCCTAAQAVEVTQAMDVAKQWAGTRWPLWMGEFGSYEKAPYDSRIRWTRLARDEAEKRGIAWAYWEMASGFGIWNPANKTWRTELRDALTGP